MLRLSLARIGKSAGVLHNRLVLVSSCALMFVATSVLGADVVTLNSGEVLEGRILSENDSLIRIEVPNKSRTIFSTKIIEKTQIKSISRESKERQEERTDWEALSSYALYPNQELAKEQYAAGIAAFQAFVRKYPQSTHIGEANAKIAEWQAEAAYLEKGKVKFANKWMSPEQKAIEYAQWQKDQQAELQRMGVRKLQEQLESLRKQRQQLADNLAITRQKLTSATARLQNLKDTEEPIYSYRDLGTVRGGMARTERTFVGYRTIPNPERPKLQSEVAFYQGQITSGESRLQELHAQIRQTESALASAQKEAVVAEARQSQKVAISPQASGSVDSLGLSVRCDDEIRKQSAPIRERYQEDLDALAKSYQAQGDLDNLLAVKSEQERFSKSAKIDLPDIVRTPQKLRELQEKYRESFSKTARSVARQHVADLEELKRTLTVDGKLDEAIAVQSQIRALKQKYMIVD